MTRSEGLSRERGVGDRPWVAEPVRRRYRPGDSGMIEIRERIAGPLFAFKGMPATIADPEFGAISVPNVRTVVVLPAPFGPRKPNTSP
jgi:hypothetical protein